MNNSSSILEDFDIFIDKISLNESLIDDIIAKHNPLTKMIKTDPPKDYVVEKSRLSGSYAKRIVLNEYEDGSNPDVDVIIILSNPNDDVYKIHEDFINYLKEKKDAVTKDIRQQSNSIGLLYSNINVDIVLAKEQNDKLMISSYKNGNWIESNALKHIDSLSNLCSGYEINIRKLFKLFKYFNKFVLNNGISSFTLEMILYHCIPPYSTNQTIPQMFSDTLKNIIDMENIEILCDCIDENKPGYDDKDKVVFFFFQEEIVDYYKKCEKALEGDLYLWEEIFGSNFPKQPQSKVVNNNNYNSSHTPWCRL